MPHPNARLTPRARLELVREVAAGFSQAEVARRFGVSRHTVAKWVRRFRRQGAAGLADRSSAPHRHPRRTPPVLERRICAVRRSEGLGPHRIAWALGIARSTVYAVLRRAGLNRLDRLHRVSREIVRYEHSAPGDLLDLGVKRLGRIPDRGGHRVHGPRAPRRASVAPGTTSCTSPSTTTAATLTSRHCPTSAERPLPPSSSAPSPRSAGAAPTCGRCSPTTRGPTTRAPSARSPMPTPSASSARSLTAHRRTARRSASSASRRTSGLTLAPTAPTPTACGSCRAGSIATITADRTGASTGPSPHPAREQRPWEVHQPRASAVAERSTAAPRSATTWGRVGGGYVRTTLATPTAPSTPARRPRRSRPRSSTARRGGEATRSASFPPAAERHGRAPRGAAGRCGLTAHMRTVSKQRGRPHEEGGPGSGGDNQASPKPDAYVLAPPPFLSQQTSTRTPWWAPRRRRHA